MGDQERRRYKRIARELQVRLHIAEDGGCGRTVTAIGTHLSPEGIFVQISDPPPPGTPVTVTLDAEGTDGVLSAEGVVIGRVVLDDEVDRPPGIGISLEKTGAAWRKVYEWLK